MHGSDSDEDAIFKAKEAHTNETLDLLEWIEMYKSSTEQDRKEVKKFLSKPEASKRKEKRNREKGN